MEGEPLLSFDKTWIFIMLLVLLTVFAFLKRSNSSRFQLFLGAFWSNRFRNQILRDEINFTSPLMVFLQVVNITILSLVASYLLYFVIDSRHTLSFVTYFFISITSFTTVYLLKFFLVKVFGLMFRLEALASRYLLEFVLFSGMLAIVLFPITALLFFNSSLSPFIWPIALFLTGAFFLFRIGKFGLTILKYSPKHFIYLLLYICTLEILPVLATSKWFLES